MINNPWDHIPQSFLIKNGVKDKTFTQFLELTTDEFNPLSRSCESDEIPDINLWIIKPGENTNRGKGIKVCKTVEQLKKYMNSYKRD